jgi:hypothetical protein
MPSEPNLAGPKRGSPIPTRTRANRDWIMISLGVLLIFLFLVTGYLSLASRGNGTGGPVRGPVKNPNALHLQNMPGETGPRQK